MKILFDSKTISDRVALMAKQVNHDYKDKNLVVVGVLNGAFIFMADLVRHLTVPLTVDFLRVASYQGQKSSGAVRLELDTTQPIQGRDVLLVEDIVDTGLTLAAIKKHLMAQNPSSLKICTLLYKEKKKGLKKECDYIGFEIPDVYVVGYGMDENGQFRELSEIRMLT